MPAQVSAVVQHESRSLAPATEDDINLIASMKPLRKGLCFSSFIVVLL